MNTQRNIFFKVTFILSIAIIYIICDHQPVNAQQDGLELFYTVTVEEGTDTAHVDVNIQNPSQSAYDFGFLLVPKDIHNFISNVKVDTGEIQSTIEYTGLNTWTIIAQKLPSSIKIGYDIAKIIPFEGSLSYTSTGGESAVFINDLGGLLFGDYFFLVPINTGAKSIQVKFNLPPGWQLVTPYIDHGTYFDVPLITNDLVRNFVQRQGIYFGKMKFYSEAMAGNSVIRFGVLEMDKASDTQVHLSTQEAVDLYAQRTALAVEKYTAIFGENPYPAFSMYNNFSPDFEQTYRFPGRELTGGLQYWPPSRFDELTGHLLYSWFSFNDPVRNESPINADRFIAKGLGEQYLGNKMAYELTGDEAYLGKVYSSYLVYKRALNTQYISLDEINTYYKGSVFGLYLDSLIQEETNNTKSIYDVFGYLYKKFKNSGHMVSIADLEEAVNAITNKDHSVIFNKYVYGNEEIPVQDIIQPYKDSFGAFLEVLGSDAWYKNYQGYAIPFFIDIEMSIPLYFHIPTGLLIENFYQQFAEYIIKNYDVDKITEENVESSLSTLTGRNSNGFFERWQDSYGELSLDDLKDWLNYYSTHKGSDGSIGESIDFINSSIILDGISSDWPEIPPLTTDPQDSTLYDLAALYVFSDENYLYLRIDSYGDFPAEGTVQIGFSIVAQGENKMAFNCFTILDQPEYLHLVPIENNVLQWDLGKVYKGAGLDRVYEAVIPLEYLQNPKSVTIDAYVSVIGEPSRLDSFSPVKYSIGAGPATIASSSTPLTSTLLISTSTLAPTRLASTPKLSSTNTPPTTNEKSPLSDLNLTVTIFGSVALLIGVFFILRKRRH